MVTRAGGGYEAGDIPYRNCDFIVIHLQHFNFRRSPLQQLNTHRRPNDLSSRRLDTISNRSPGPLSRHGASPSLSTPHGRGTSDVGEESRGA